jgi:uncharacterized membrane protein YuzA (DUF378 family)
MIGKVLLVVGGLNWGLIGVGMFMNADWNFVKVLLGSWPVAEAVVYVLVGIAAVASIFHCKCSRCREACAACASSGEEKSM